MSLKSVEEHLTRRSIYDPIYRLGRNLLTVSYLHNLFLLQITLEIFLVTWEELLTFAPVLSSKTIP